MVKAKYLIGLLLIVAALGEGCTSKSQSSQPPTTTLNANPTFNKDVGPLLQAKCMQCHSVGQIETAVQFDTYDKAVNWASSISDEVNSGTMPPWPLAAGNSHYVPGSTMPTFQNTRALSADELSLINTWIKNGMPKGDGGDMQFQPPPSDTLAGPNVIKATMPQPFLPAPAAGALDEYRCFLLDPISASQDSWVTAYQMLPDQFQETHHAIVYVPQTAADLKAAKALETVPGQGYDCLTGPGNGVNADILTLWAPGTGIVRYPDSTAIKVPAGMSLIMQIHYNIRAGATADQTSILLEAHPSQSGLIEAYWFPAGVGVPIGTTIPLNNPDVQFPLTQKVPDLFFGGKSVTIYGIYPHEHRLGTRVHAEFNQGGTGLEFPLFDDYPWDFNWQDGYFFANTISLSALDSVTVTCHYDTTLDSKGNDITGVNRTAPVPFGEFTTDEMCFGFLFGAVTW